MIKTKEVQKKKKEKKYSAKNYGTENGKDQGPGRRVTSRCITTSIKSAVVFYYYILYVDRLLYKTRLCRHNVELMRSYDQLINWK